MIPLLIVDDDASIRQMMREILEDEGFATSTAKDGGPALDQMRASTKRLLVLLGLTMPEVDGEQVLEAVASDPELAARHRVIMVTANIRRATTGRVAELRQQLNVPLRPKPFDVNEIINLVKDVAASMAR
jgi:CheY-like chemotaxis protein